MAERFDNIVIGAGQSGIPLAKDFAKRGQKTALIEMNEVGGSCINYGCIPTKTIIASARVAHLARRAADFGVETGKVTVDIQKVIQRKDERVHGARGSLENGIAETENLTLIRGRAIFKDAKVVTVNDEEYEADRFVVNTGSRPSVPNIPGIKDVPYLTNTELLEIDTLPEHLIIIGGSYIGLEFGQAFRRFGSEVTVIESASHLIAREAYDISIEVRRIMESEGLNILTSVKVTKVEQRGKEIVVTVEGNTGSHDIVGSHLLLAVGRRPNSDNVGLDNAGVHMNEHGYVEVDDRLQTSCPHIWAIGEVNGNGPFTHTSYNDYEILADVLFGEDQRRVSKRIPTYAVFIDPPLGRVGMNEREAQEKGKEALIGVLPMASVGKARNESETAGVIKVLVDPKTEKFLGASILGVAADEVVAGITNLMYAGASYKTLLNAVHIHPTVNELMPTVMQNLGPLK